MGRHQLDQVFNDPVEKITADCILGMLDFRFAVRPTT
jgi:hypothetical protein